MEKNTVPKRHWLLLWGLQLGLASMTPPVFAQAILPYSPNLDQQQLEQQGLALTEDVVQLVRFQQYDLAFARAKLATQLAPERFQTWFILGTLYLQKEELEPGVKVLKKAEVMAPQEAGIKFTLGNAYFQQGNYQGAVEVLQAGLKQRPGIPAALFDMGNAYLKLNQFPKAVDAYEQALAAEAEFWPALNNIGLIEYEQGNIDGAVKRWQTVVTMDKEQAEPQLAIAVAMYKQGKTQAAIEQATAALELDSRYGELDFLVKNLWGEKLIKDTKVLFATPVIATLIKNLPPPSDDSQG